jgi:hypothetical protein
VRDILIACRLETGPKGQLPPWGGLLDAAEEHGLWSYLVAPGGAHRLPEGLLWGRFADEARALAAFDSALHEASWLLGYPVRATRRLACATAAATEAENPVAPVKALLYLLSR